MFRSPCGHMVTFSPVIKVGGKMEGKWQVRVSGPSVTGQKGIKVLYSEPTDVKALEMAARYLRIRASQFIAGGDAPRAASVAATPTRGSFVHHASYGGHGAALGSAEPAVYSSTSCVRLSVPGQPAREILAGFGGGSRGYSGSVDASAANVVLAAPTGEQARVIDLVVRHGKSVFLTGSAGTGKSFVLKHIQKGLTALLPPGSLHLTAPTGIAAINIGGSTIHAFAGIGLGVGPHDRIIAKCVTSQKTVARWQEAHCLIIDEISMVSADMFELLSSVAKACRGNDLPFGGLQLVLCGDFFQLGPVNPYRGAHGKVFAFEADAWAAAVQHNVCLKQVVRQQGDRLLTTILEEIRWGTCSQATQDALAACARPLPSSNGVLATRLYCTNVKVDDENARELGRLAGETHTYTAAEGGDKEALDALEKGCPAAAILELKVAAQVVLVWNLSERLVNGSRGVVMSFNGASGLPIVRFNNGEVREVEPHTWNRSKDGRKASRTQIPLKLAWALTVHRAQGMTLDKVECVLGDAFADGQVYVALSRVTALSGMQLRDFNGSKVRASAAVASFYRSVCS